MQPGSLNVIDRKRTKKLTSIIILLLIVAINCKSVQSITPVTDRYLDYIFPSEGTHELPSSARLKELKINCLVKDLNNNEDSIRELYTGFVKYQSDTGYNFERDNFFPEYNNDGSDCDFSKIKSWKMLGTVSGKSILISANDSKTGTPVLLELKGYQENRVNFTEKLLYKK